MIKTKYDEQLFRQAQLIFMRTRVKDYYDTVIPLINPCNEDYLHAAERSRDRALALAAHINEDLLYCVDKADGADNPDITVGELFAAADNMFRGKYKADPGGKDIITNAALTLNAEELMISLLRPIALLKREQCVNIRFLFGRKLCNRNPLPVAYEDKILRLQYFFRNNEKACMDFSHMNYNDYGDEAGIFALEYCLKSLMFMRLDTVNKLYSSMLEYKAGDSSALDGFPVDEELLKKVLS